MPAQPRSRLRGFALPRAGMLGPVGPKRRCNGRRIGRIMTRRTGTEADPRSHTFGSAIPFRL